MKRILAILAICLGLSFACWGQAPPDVPVSHVNVAATFTGINAGGTMHPANIDTFGIDLTEYVTVGYEHISIPDFNSRYEMVVVNYHNTFPKIKALLFDSSNFVYSVGGGAGKYLSPAGNHWAETVTGSITYPIAGHMGWQIVGYQYVHSPAAGVVNKSYQTVSSGPILYF